MSFVHSQPPVQKSFHFRKIHQLPPVVNVGFPMRKRNKYDIFIGEKYRETEKFSLVLWVTVLYRN